MGREFTVGDTRLLSTVEDLSHGNLTESGPMMRGAMRILGPTACLRINDNQIVIVSIKIQILNREFYGIAGAKLEKIKIMSKKSSVRFRAAF